MILYAILSQIYETEHHVSLCLPVSVYVYVQMGVGMSVDD